MEQMQNKSVETAAISIEMAVMCLFTEYSRRFVELNTEQSNGKHLTEQDTEQGKGRNLAEQDTEQGKGRNLTEQDIEQGKGRNLTEQDTEQGKGKNLTEQDIEQEKAENSWIFSSAEELFELAYERQLLDSADYLYRKGEVDRRTVARILHRFLQLVLQEAEDRGKSVDMLSSQILDLSDCRTCAGHILQVVHKGIMTTVSDGMFQGREAVSLEEMKRIVQRTLNPEDRYPYKEQ